MNSMMALTPYERRMLSGKRKSKADMLKDKSVFSNFIREGLCSDIQMTMDDGSVLDVPVGKLLVAKRLNYLLQHPEEISFKEITAALGENRVDVNLNTDSAADLFRGITAGSVVEDVNADYCMETGDSDGSGTR